MQLKLLKQIIENNFKTNTIIEKLCSLKTTHLIIGNATNNDGNILNAKILLAVLNNCKLVKFDWVTLFVLFTKNLFIYFIFYHRQLNHQMKRNG
jgi:hypothetical protein